MTRLPSLSGLTWARFGERLSARYNPYRGDRFQVVEPEQGGWDDMSKAKAALLDGRGLHVHGATWTRTPTRYFLHSDVSQAPRS